MNEHVLFPTDGNSKTLNNLNSIQKIKMKLLLSLATLGQSQWLTNYAPG